jgi:hypothetical protein
MMGDTSIGVCGFGRCGSTMAMAMLAAGGIPLAAGSNPRSGELDDLDGLSAVELAGRAVKLLDLVVRQPLPPANWRLIWLDRDPVQQAKSTVKFLRGIAGVDLRADAVDQLAASYMSDRPDALRRLRATGPVLVLEYERVLAQPKRAARRLALHVAGVDDLTAVRPSGLWFDVRAAAAVVHRRDGSCRPDLAFEEGVA